MAKHKSPFEDRERKRSTVILSGVVVHVGVETRCRVRDVSIGGCRVACDMLYPPGTPLHIELSRYGRFPAIVAWTDAGEMGLAFPEGAATALARFGDGAERLGIVEPLREVDPAKVVPLKPPA